MEAMMAQISDSIIANYQRRAMEMEMDRWEDDWLSAAAKAATKELSALEMANGVEPVALGGERFMRWPVLGQAAAPGPWSGFANAILSHRAQQAHFEVAFPSELYLHIKKTQKFRDVMPDVDLANMSGDNFNDNDVPWPDHQTGENPSVSRDQIDRIRCMIDLTEGRLGDPAKIPALFGEELNEEEEFDGDEVDWVGAALKDYDDTYRANSLNSDFNPEPKAVPAAAPGVMTNWYRKGPVGRGPRPPPKVTKDVADQLAQDYAWLLADDPPATSTMGGADGNIARGAPGLSGYNSGPRSAAAPEAAVPNPTNSANAKGKKKRKMKKKNATTTPNATAAESAPLKASTPEPEPAIKKPTPKKNVPEEDADGDWEPGGNDLYNE
ncbi:hypothetical protein EYC80_001792 [Monilinia laxa]|uniref:Uncharacterized protein n=1 Tax=Monilinia laxa TaxID=61186 RepID=A0A5N6K656_MONLA|nr:hypothetical protein EYC80_001792 [Monilinia laxa]